MEIEAPNTCSELIIASQAYLAHPSSKLMCCRLLYNRYSVHLARHSGLYMIRLSTKIFRLGTLHLLCFISKRLQFRTIHKVDYYAGQFKAKMSLHMARVGRAKL